MSGVTLSQAQAQLATWLAASTAVASKQSYTINGRSLTMANAAEIRENIDYWERRIVALERIAAGRSRHGFSVCSFK